MPQTFQQAIEAIIALYLSFLPAPAEAPAPAPAAPAAVAAPAAEAPAPADAPELQLNPSGSVTDMNTGWVTYPSGEVRCITGAPCEQDDAFTGAEASAYDWTTGEAYTE